MAFKSFKGFAAKKGAKPFSSFTPDSGKQAKRDREFETIDYKPRIAQRYAASDWPLITIIGAKLWQPLKMRRELPPEMQDYSDAQILTVIRKFAWYLSRLLRDNVKSAIKTQKYKHRHPALADATVKRKGHSDTWIDSGNTLKAIDAWQAAGQFHVGFRAKKLHPDSKTPYVTIAQTLEFGSEKRKIPARPVFMPEAQLISKSISRVFKAWLHAGGAKGVR